MDIRKKIARQYYNAKLFNHIKAFTQYNIGKGLFEINPKEKNIYFLMIPNYGNLGDQAIAEGSLCFLKDFCPDYHIEIIDLFDTCKKMPSIEKAIKPNDLVVIQGGGNMGNLYPYIENYRRYIFKHLKNQRIISMPVTATYTNDKEGKISLKNGKKIYGECKDLTIIAREKYSYHFLIKEFPQNRILLCPDIAFYLYDENSRLNKDRRGTLICIRRDQESNYNREADYIVNNLMKLFDDAVIMDTTVTRDISDDAREMEISSALRILRHTKLVITDRMHAMILSALAGTPCIVSKSKDKKIIGTYEWIKNLNYIKYVNNLNDFNYIKKLSYELENIVPDKLQLKSYYNDLANMLFHEDKMI